MSAGKKIVLALVMIVAIAATVVYAVTSGNRGVVAVETGEVIRQDLSQSVRANGEVKPKRYVNISSNAFGRILSLPVQEGDRVEENDFLLQIESVTTEADVLSAQASLDAAGSELAGMDASIRSAEASVASVKAEKNRVSADFTRSKQEFERAQELFEGGLISREEFDRQESSFNVAVAQGDAADARVIQTEAQLAQVLLQKEGLQFRMGQQRASVTRARDALSKTTIRAPLAGVITYLPVNEGENAIIGVQNQPGTTLMTIADMSVITAELRVDETDIINLRLGQQTEIRVDALGDRLLSGFVSEIGNTALNSAGQGGISATTASTEAKDFKVVITLDSPPPELRPGLSCTATIETASQGAALTVPIQALTVREIEQSELPDYIDDPVLTTPRPGETPKVEQEGVFVVESGSAIFRPVKTGIVGTTDIEILEGLSEGEEIVIGSYRILRTLDDETRVKIEESPFS